jgi:hypothetical protein
VAADQRAFTVKVALPPGIDARPGAFARVRFEGDRRRVLVVPATAVRAQGQLASVVVVADNTARVRLVQTGDTDRETAEIVAGLDAGEMVVTRPPPGLADGQAVLVRVATPPGAAR